MVDFSGQCVSSLTLVCQQPNNTRWWPGYEDDLIRLNKEKGVCSVSLSPDWRSLLSPQEAIQLDGEILYALLRRVSPVAHRHLKKHKLEPILYMTEWFMCAFSRTLPWASVLRVWDMFLCEGEILHWCIYCITNEKARWMDDCVTECTLSKHSLCLHQVNPLVL